MTDFGVLLVYWSHKGTVSCIFSSKNCIAQICGPCRPSLMLVMLAKQSLQQIGYVPNSTRSNNCTSQNFLTYRPLLVLLLPATQRLRQVDPVSTSTRSTILTAETPLT